MNNSTPTTIRRLITAALSTALIALAALPAAASASQVMIESGVARYKSSGGEDNKVTATKISNEAVKFTDTGAVIWNAGPGCTIIDEHTAACAKPGGLYGVNIGTGSSDDQVLAEMKDYTVRLVIESGSDDDSVKVTGSKYTASINSSSGADTIEEGDGRSTIYADGANTGVGGADTVIAGAQRDVIYGGKQGDTLTGGPGADEIRGQQGNDTINALDGTADAVLGCGPDQDTISADPQDNPGAECENVL